MQMRCRYSAPIITCLTDFKRYLKNLKDLDRIDEVSKKDVEDNNSLIDLSKAILDNPDVLDMPLWYFLQTPVQHPKLDTFSQEISVIHLKNHLHTSIENLKTHFTIIADMIEKDLIKFTTTLKEHPLLNPSKTLLEILAKFKKEQLPRLNAINVNDISELFNQLSALKRVLMNSRSFLLVQTTIPKSNLLET